MRSAAALLCASLRLRATRRSCGRFRPVDPRRERRRERTFLQVRDAVVQRGERGLHFVALLAVVPGGAFGLLQRVDAGQHLLLHVVYLVLQQVFEAVGLHRAVASTVLLRETEDRRTLSLRVNFSASNVRGCLDVCPK